MKVIQVARHGPPEVLTCVEAPVRQPEPHEVLVRVHSIGVGIPDISIRAGTYRWMPKLPVVPGSELSGTVEATGSAVTNLRIGDRVMMSARENDERGGCYAEFVTTAAAGLFPLPAGIDMAGAATLSNYQLVRLLMTEAATVRSGQTILVYAAAGGVGSALVDVASRAGMNVIGVAKGRDKVAAVRAMGAVRAVDRACESVPEAVAEMTGGRGVDVIFDSVGGPGFPANVALLGHLGQLVSYGALDGPPRGDLLAAMREHRHHVPAVRTFSIHAYDDRPERRRGAMAWAIEQLVEGKIRPAIHAALPLTEARTAHEMLEGGRTIGKVLLQP